jgi:Tfp pilus assembly protein PilF
MSTTGCNQQPEQVVSMKPATIAAGLFVLGNKLFERGKTEQAIAAFRRCLASAPDHVAASYNLGNALIKVGRPTDAVDSYLICLRHKPDFGPAFVNLAETLRGLGLLENAQEMAELGIHHLPASPDAINCLANVMHDRSEYSTAAMLYRRMLDYVPGHAGALSNLGNALHALGRLTEALAAHESAVAAAPEEADFRFNRATTLLASGDFARGWDEYEWRWQRARSRPRDFGEAWQGEDIAGRTILLHAEQGLGDALQFVRYVPMVAERCSRVVLEVQPPLVRLMQTLPGVALVVARGDAIPAFDVHCPLMSLPRAFATRLETIPARLPYLHADPAAVAAWQSKLPRDGNLRVGLVWAGSSHTDDAGAHKIDLRRSLDLSEFAPLANLAGLHLVSLQKDNLAEQRRRPPDFPLIDLMSEVTDFCDTAALIANLDLVISVDTSVAHLAGGMGKPVWLMSRYDGCWRWLYNREDSPWYPGLQIYRQQRPNDWPAVVTRVREDLAALLRQSASP